VHFGVGVTRSVASVATSRAGSTVSVSVWVRAACSALLARPFSVYFFHGPIAILTKDRVCRKRQKNI
jgi:hypothetical protein